MKAKAYYNENDPFTAAWLRRLISAGYIMPGDVDDRSIVDVQTADLVGYTQCHFFAGIGGWSYALRLAGWPDTRSVWTGSCPCQPFSSASRGRSLGESDSFRHLWPEEYRLLLASAPHVVFGEQVAQAKMWFEHVCNDLEAVGYEIGAAVLPACSVGADHARHRIYFVGHTNSHSKSKCPVYGKMAGVSWHTSNAGTMAKPYGVSNRMGRLRGYGNALVPQVAAAFIQAYMECENA